MDKTISHVNWKSTKLYILFVFLVSLRYYISKHAMSLWPELPVTLGRAAADEEVEDREDCKEAASEPQQQTVEQWQNYIERPLLVRWNRGPLHYQIQVTPCQILD